MKNLLKKFIALAVFTALPILAQAQGWAPSKPVTIIVPVAAGASNDLVARILAERLPSRLGQAVVVDNKPGAGGIIGVAAMARSAADGHTLSIAPSTIYMVPHLTPKAGGVGFNVTKDTTPILTAGIAPLLIVAQPSIRVKTAKELVAYLKKMGPSSYSHGGTGSPMHIAGELFGRRTGVQLTDVPYKGVLPAVNAVLAGEVPFGIVALAGAAPFIAAGTLTPIALVEKQRSELIPSLPTLSESGITGVEVSVFLQILAPSGTPVSIIRRYNKDINEVLAAPDVREKLNNIGVQVVGGTSESASKQASETFARNGRLVKELHLGAE